MNLKLMEVAKGKPRGEQKEKTPVVVAHPSDKHRAWR